MTDDPITRHAEHCASRERSLVDRLHAAEAAFRLGSQSAIFKERLALVADRDRSAPSERTSFEAQETVLFDASVVLRTWQSQGFISMAGAGPVDTGPLGTGPVGTGQPKGQAK